MRPNSPHTYRDNFGDETLICKCCGDFWDRWSNQVDRASIRETMYCTYCAYNQKRYKDCNCKDIHNDL